MVGGETTGEGLAPGASTALTVAFRPQATGPRDLEKGTKTLRKASLAVLDNDGAVVGAIPLEGVARPPSAETLDAAAVTDLQREARRSGRSHVVPRSFDDIRRQLLAARDLIGTSERDAASELMDGVAERFAQALTYEHVYQAARKHGLGAMTATQAVAAARDEVTRFARNLHGTVTVLPAHMDKLVGHLEVAKEPIQLTLGEIKSAPSLQAMNDANPVVMAGHAAQELGKTAVELATDAAFAAGFGVGVLRGAGGALVDLAAGVADVARLAFDLAGAWFTGGMLGVALEVAGKVDAFFTKMPTALQAMGKSFQDGWNAPDSFDRGSFRGEVISYVAAQIAIVIVSGGAASEGVAFASLSRWGKVARVIEMLDAAGDITTWARGAVKAVEGADELLDQVRRLRGGMKRTRPSVGSAPAHAHAPDAPDSPEARHGDGRRTPATESEGTRRADTNARAEQGTTPPPRDPEGAWATGAKRGVDPTPESIAVGTVRMEEHPDYARLIASAQQKGFTVVTKTTGARVALIHLVDSSGAILEIRRELHLLPGMRFLDLEHELGHIEQLERLGESARHTETIVRAADGTETPLSSPGHPLRKGEMTEAQNSVTEYHNRLVELQRLLDRDAPRKLLEDHHDGLERWRRTAESNRLGRGSEMTGWAQAYFPELPALEDEIIRRGYPLNRESKRW